MAKQVSVREAARRLGVTRGRVRQLIAEGRLETTTIDGGGPYGYSRLIDVESLNSYRRKPSGRPVTTGKVGMQKERAPGQSWLFHVKRPIKPGRRSKRAPDVSRETSGLAPARWPAGGMATSDRHVRLCAGGMAARRVGLARQHHRSRRRAMLRR